jgi:broad specificity phosphatase PhoE
MALGDLEGLTVDEANAMDAANMHHFSPNHIILYRRNGEDFRQGSARMAVSWTI